MSAPYGKGAADRRDGSRGKRQDAPPRGKTDNNQWNCPSCNLRCSSKQDLQMHYQMTNHNVTSPSTSAANKPAALKADSTAPIIPGTIPMHIRRACFVLKDYVQRTDRDPVVGVEYILKYQVQVRPDKVETKYYCEICELDTDLIPIMEHLSGFRHLKLYLAKAFPYVLKAASKSKEDRTQFLKRMAMEIEQEEGTKMYKIDPVLRMVPMMNVKSTAAKQAKRKTRWDVEGDRQGRMRKALVYLDSFEIDNDREATTVMRLTEKLTAELKLYSDKLKEEALFPAKVARAKDIAMSIARKPAQKNPTQNIPSLLNVPLVNPILGTPSVPPPIINPYWAPNAAFPQVPPVLPFFPSNQKQDYPVPMENPQRDQTAEAQVNQASEEVTFVKKLMTLLSALPASTPQAESSQMESKLQMLKSLLQDKTSNVENTPENQLMQVASWTQGMTSAENAYLTQQLGMMTSKNVAAVSQFSPNLTQMASMPGEYAQANQNPLMNRAALLQNTPMNPNAFLPETQNFPKQDYMPMDNSSMMLLDRSAYQRRDVEQQAGYAGMAQSEDFGYNRLMAGNSGNAKLGHHGEPAKSMIYTPEEPTTDLYDDMGYEPGPYSKEWEEPSTSSISKRGANQEYGGSAAKQAPYTRVSLSPTNDKSKKERFQDSYQGSRRESRSHEARPSYGARSSRPFDDPAWAERESDPPYGKRAKLDGDRVRPRSRDRGVHRSDESASRGVDPENLSLDLLKRIRGKDLFTVSAILSEYKDRRPSK